MATLEQIRLLTVRGRAEGLDRVQAELAGVSRAHFDVARASEEAAKATESSARRQGSVASGWSKLTSEMQGSSRAAKEYANTVRLIAQAEAQGLTSSQQASQARMFAQSRLQDAAIRSPSVDQSGVNQLLGVGPQAKSAKDSASAFEEAAREAEAMERQVAALRAQLDPLAAVQGRLNAELQEYRTLAAAGAISGAELAAAEAMVGTRMMAAEKHIGAAGSATKLTAFQMTGLGYQINDIGTMLAMGASPFLIISSQAGQIIQVLGDGPGGVAGSLKAMGESLTGVLLRINPVTAGFVAVGGALVGYALLSRQQLKPMEDVLRDQSDLLRDIGELYDGLPEKVARYGQKSKVVLGAGLEINADDFEKQARKAATDLRIAVQDVSNFEGFGADGKGFGVMPQFEPVREQLREFFAEYDAGRKTLADLEIEMSSLYSTAADGSALKDAAKTVRDMSKAGADAALKLQVTTGTIKEMSDAARAAASMFEAFKDGYSDLSGMIPDLRTDAERINAAFQDAILSAPSPSAFEGLRRARDAALSGINRDASDTLRDEGNQRALVGLKGEAAAIADVNQRYDELARQYAGASDALAILNDARQAAIERVRAEAAQEEADALRDRSRARLDGVTSLQSEIAALGMSRGAALALRMEEEQILALRRRAEDEGGIVSEDEIAEIRRAAEATGALTDSITALTMAREQQGRLRGLVVDAASVGASDDAHRRALATLEAEERLRSQGVDVNSRWGETYVRNAQKLSDFEDVIRRQKDAWGELRSAGESAIDGLVDGLSSGKFDLDSILKDISKTFLELAVGNPLKNGLLGTSYGTLGDLMTGKAAAPSLGMPDLQSVAAMNVTAGVVNLGGPGAGGAMGAINGMLNPANSNAPLGAGGMSPYRSAISSIESGGRYDALGPWTGADRAYGKYQVMGANVGPWSQSALGMQLTPEQFLANPEFQDRIFDHIFGGYVGKYGASGAAQAWFGGPGSVGKGGMGSDVLGTTGNAYVQKFNAALGDVSGASSNLAATATGFTTDFSQVTGAINAGIGQAADQFVPGFGGVLTKILDGMQQPGGGGGIGGFLGSIFGGGAGISAGTSSAILGGAQGLFAFGGYTGPGGKYDPAGIVHRGEYVFDQDAVKRIGVDTLDGMRRGLRGYAAGGYVNGSPARLPANLNPMPMSGGGPRVINNYIDQRASGAPIETKERTDQDGTIVLDHYIRDIARDENSPSGKGGRQNKAFYGLSPKIIQR